MTIAKITEISSTSKEIFDDAIRKGIKRASKTLDNITGAWVQDQKVDVKSGKITGYRVNLKLTFILSD